MTRSRTIQYHDISNNLHSFTVHTAPQEHQKKATLMLYFAEYMETHLIAGGNLVNGQKDHKVAVFMKKWFRTEKAIVMYLSDGTLQVAG